MWAKMVLAQKKAETKGVTEDNTSMSTYMES